MPEKNPEWIVCTKSKIQEYQTQTHNNENDEDNKTKERRLGWKEGAKEREKIGW